MPVRSAAHAVAAPWLPVDAVTTASAPAARYFSSDGSAPRHLKAPSSCTSSRFRNSGRPPDSSGGASSSGVGRSVTTRILTANLGRVSATTDEKLEAANWDLEPLVDGRGPEAVESLLTEARERAERFAEAHRGRVAELDSA